MPRRQKMIRQPNADEEKMKQDALEIMRSARRDMLMRFPFWGFLAMAMEIVPVLDERLPVACTDGKTVYVNAYVVVHPEKAFKKQFPERVLTGIADSSLAVLAHEVCHSALLHFDRGEDKIPETWNLAADAEIGYLLEKAGIPDLSVARISSGNMLNGWPAERIYAFWAPVNTKRVKSPFALFDGKKALPVDARSGQKSTEKGDAQKEQKDGCDQAGSGDENKTSAEGKSGPNGNGWSQGEDGQIENDSEQKNKLNGKGSDATAENDSSAAGQSAQKIEGLRKNGQNAPDNVYDTRINEKFVSGHYSRMRTFPKVWQREPYFGNEGVRDPDFTPDANMEKDETDFLRQKWQENVKNAVNRYGVPGFRPGNLPGNLIQIINAKHKNTVDWKQLLLDYVSQTFHGELQWIPPNRRHVWRGIYLPGRAKKKVIEIVLAVDTSGSTTEDLPAFLAELRGMTSAFGEYKITIIQCDTELHSVKEYTNDEPLPEDLRFYGFGGTCLIPPFKYVEEKMQETPTVFIYLTDGYGEAPAQAPDYPVIWCLTEHGVKPAQGGLDVKIKKT